MAILKPGFRPGFRGRSVPAAWCRRAHYLASELERDGVVLQSLDRCDLTAEQAVEALGGPHVAYHEIILAPSIHECATIRGRQQDGPRGAALEAGHRVAKAYAKGRPYVLAMHEGDGRFHFHLAVAGPMGKEALGPHGQVQKQWTREIFGDEPRIVDWEAHGRFLEVKNRLQECIREQRRNDQARRSALRNLPPSQKGQKARPFEVKARQLIERRFSLEVAALSARYEARGTLGGHRHLAELQQASHRRTGALHRLDRRVSSRVLQSVGRHSERVLGTASRTAERGIRIGGGIGRMASNVGLRVLGVPRPLRAGARAVLAVAQESTITALRLSVEMARTAGRSGLHVAQAAITLGAGLLAAPVTAGGSLKAAGKEAGKDLLGAGREVGAGVLRSAVEAGSGTARAIAAGGQELLPRELRAAAQFTFISAQTAMGATKDLVTLSPVSLGQTLVGGAMGAGRAVFFATGLHASLPEPLRRAFQLAGWIPMAGALVKATQLATEVIHTAHNAASRGMEIER